MESAAKKELRVGRAEPYSGVGAELRILREEQGHSLPEVGRALKISPRYLTALEEGAFADLPGPAYVLGFLRSYAAFLGVSPVVAVEKFKRESSYEDKPDLDFPVPVRETNVPRVSWVWGSPAIVVALLCVWYFIQESGKVEFDEIAEVPERFWESAERRPIAKDRDVVAEVTDGRGADEPVGEVETIAVADTEFELEPSDNVEAKAPMSSAEEAELSDSIISVPAEFEAPSVSDDPEGDEVRPNIVPTPPAPPVESQAGQQTRIYGAENSMSRVTLLAVQDSWVQVEGPDGKLLITRILYTGDSYRVPNRSGLTLITGNAGGLKIIVDDIEAPPLGPLGAVRRGVLLDPEGFLEFGSSDLE